MVASSVSGDAHVSFTGQLGQIGPININAGGRIVTQPKPPAKQPGPPNNGLFDRLINSLIRVATPDDALIRDFATDMMRVIRSHEMVPAGMHSLTGDWQGKGAVVDELAKHCLAIGQLLVDNKISTRRGLKGDDDTPTDVVLVRSGRGRFNAAVVLHQQQLAAAAAAGVQSESTERKETEREEQHAAAAATTATAPPPVTKLPPITPQRRSVGVGVGVGPSSAPKPNSVLGKRSFNGEEARRV